MQGTKSLNILVLGTDIVVSFFRSEATPWLSKTFPNIPDGFDVPPRTSSHEVWTLPASQASNRRESNSHTSIPTRQLHYGSCTLHLSEPCLGRATLSTTKSATIASHKKEIPYDRLPLTFQEAINYTRQLVVSYFWIDSLCIIQDDKYDWRYHAAHMSFIYESAYLVLSAAKSPNAYGGLFVDFPFNRCKTYTIDITPNIEPPRATERIHVRQSLPHLNTTQTLIRSTNSAQRKSQIGTILPTLTRGWIFQERFLASRVLHFGPEELFWEYIFPALSGLATAMKYSVQYNITRARGVTALTTAWVAGLWSHSLHRDLLWRVVDYDDEQDHRDTPPRTRRPSRWRAPSWPWASVTGPVEFLGQTEGMAELEPRCEIIDYYRRKTATRILMPVRVLKNVKGGHFFALRGSLIPAVANVRGPTSSDSRDKRKKGWEIMDLDIFSGHLKNVWVDDVAHWLGKDDDHASQQGQHQVSCFLVGVKKTKALCFLILETLQEGQQGMTSVGLEVEDSTGQKEWWQHLHNGTDYDGIQNLYQRVGVAEVFGGPPGPGSWRERLLGLGHNQVLKIF
ncbi:Heterokaryon incompatibility protein (HET) domain containing protein [Rhypophila decipiens]